MSTSLRALFFVCLIQLPFSAWSVQKNPQITACNQLTDAKREPYNALNL